MRAVIQRVTRADVKIAAHRTGEIGPGLVVLLGVAAGDQASDAAWLAKKIVSLRIFSDEGTHFSGTVRERARGVLVVSQFTLLARMDKGSRPSFHEAEAPAAAEKLYVYFLEVLERELGHAPSRGTFGADMQVTLTNDAPVILILDSPQQKKALIEPAGNQWA